MNIILVRHGETVANTKNHYYGVTESLLTENGNTQAKKAGKLLKHINFNPDIIYSSERIRAKETLKLMGFDLENAIIDSRLNEKNMGIIEDMSYEEIDKKYPNLFNDWNKDFVNYTLEDGESWMDVYYRIKSILEEVKEKYAETDKTILMVCHGGIMTMAFTYIIGENFDAMYSAFFTNCSMLKCNIVNNKYVINGIFDSSLI